MHFSTILVVLASSALCYAAPAVEPREILDWTLSDLTLTLYNEAGCKGSPFTISQAEYSQDYIMDSIYGWSLSRDLLPGEQLDFSALSFNGKYTECGSFISSGPAGAVTGHCYETPSPVSCARLWHH